MEENAAMLNELCQRAAKRHITLYSRFLNLAQQREGEIAARRARLLRGFIAAYPELGCTGGPYEVGHYWGVYRDILCGGNPKTYQFIKDVLDEVCAVMRIRKEVVPRLRLVVLFRYPIRKAKGDFFIAFLSD